mmetsp:Transcript_10223/g.62394  ORF Transcript_10223/g.62394 Transcript_10223/m.62394 type:complete len:212 (+) Transcript_10223:5048-5683(+)
MAVPSTTARWMFSSCAPPGTTSSTSSSFQSSSASSSFPVLVLNLSSWKHPVVAPMTNPFTLASFQRAPSSLVGSISTWTFCARQALAWLATVAPSFFSSASPPFPSTPIIVTCVLLVHEARALAWLPALPRKRCSAATSWAKARCCTSDSSTDGSNTSFGSASHALAAVAMAKSFVDALVSSTSVGCATSFTSGRGGMAGRSRADAAIACT